MLSSRQKNDLADIRALARDLARQGQLSPGGSASEPLLAFVHIPKTAGATVTSMLSAAYSKPEIHKAGNYMKGRDKTARKVTNWHRKGGRVSVGHVPYAVFRENLPADTRYMTFLREPVDRVISHYYRHIRRDPSRAGRPVKTDGRPKADSLEQALVEMRLPQVNNLGTRLLSDFDDPSLDEARRNLAGFEFVGIQERFEESIVLLRRLLGLGSIPYVNRHVSSDRPSVEEIPDEQRRLIAEHNHLDVELYEFGLGRFERAVLEAGEGFAADVESLRGRDAAARVERVRPGNAAESLVAFVHIPKTAGATVTTMLVAAYSRSATTNTGNWVKNPEAARAMATKRPGGWEGWRGRGGRVAVGHTPYGIFRQALPPDTRYITFLREPVDRVVSHYYRHVHLPGMSDAERATRGQGRRARSLEEALVEVRLPDLCNLATRFLCSKPTLGELPPSALAEAKENLRTFASVGIQERFEESVVLLQRTLGLGLLPYRDQHVAGAGTRPSVEELSDEERALIEDSNQLDAELYAFGLELFDEALGATDAHFAADVERLRDLAEAAANEHRAAVEAARLWLHHELPAGSTEAVSSLTARAEAAGLNRPALTEARRELLVTKHEDRDRGRVFRRAADSSLTALEDAEAWLGRELPAGTAELREALCERGQAAGLSRAALNRARKRLSVKKLQDPRGQPVWSRPPQ